MVRRKPVWPNLLFTWYLQHSIHTKCSFGIPDVIQRGAALSTRPDLPTGVWWFCGPVLTQALISTFQSQWGRHKSPIHFFARIGVKISAYDQWYSFLLFRLWVCLSGDVTELLEEMSALRAPESLPSAACL